MDDKDNTGNLPDAPNMPVPEHQDPRLAQNIFSGIAVMMGGKGILMVLGFLTKILMARSLGPENLGIYGLLFYICGLASVFVNIGTQNAHVHNLGRGRASLGDAFGFSLTYAVIVGSFASVILYVLYRYWLYNVYFSQYPINKLLVTICIFLFIPANLLRLHLTTIFLGLKKFKTYNVFLLLESSSLLIVFIILIATLRHKLSAAIIAWIASILLIVFLLLAYIVLIVRPTVRFVTSNVRQILSFGFKAFLSGLTQTLITRIDLFFIGYFLSAKELGLYFLASSLTEAVDKMTVPLGQVLFSFVSGMDFRRAVALINTAFRVFLTGSVPALLAFIPIVFYGIPFIFGNNYRSSAYLLIILFPSAVARILIRTLFAFFMSQNIHENAVIAYLGALISLCLLDIVLIPRFGISGAAFGLSIAYSIGLIIIVYQYIAVTRISYSSLWRITSSDLRRFKEIVVKVRP